MIICRIHAIVFEYTISWTSLFLWYWICMLCYSMYDTCITNVSMYLEGLYVRRWLQRANAGMNVKYYVIQCNLLSVFMFVLRIPFKTRWYISRGFPFN